jgi:hypothetical protein
MSSCLHVKSVLCTGLVRTSKLWRITKRQLDLEGSCSSYKGFIVGCIEFAYESKQDIIQYLTVSFLRDFGGILIDF